jgi:hypothetical protein
VNQETKKHTAKERGGREEGGVGEGKGWGRKRKSPSQAGPVQFWWSVEIKKKSLGSSRLRGRNQVTTWIAMRISDGGY